MSQSLDECFAARDWGEVERVQGWSVKREGIERNLVFFGVSARDGQRYRVLFGCDSYPQLAPNAAFVDDEGSKTDAKAWPTGTAEFLGVVKPPPNCFLCMPLTREGLLHHPEWLKDPALGAWNPEKHTLLDLFNYVHRLLNSDEYTGRGRA
jgi:hypothetical protein